MQQMFNNKQLIGQLTSSSKTEVQQLLLECNRCVWKSRDRYFGKIHYTKWSMLCSAVLFDTDTSRKVYGSTLTCDHVKIPAQHSVAGTECCSKTQHNTSVQHVGLLRPLLH